MKAAAIFPLVRGHLWRIFFFNWNFEKITTAKAQGTTAKAQGTTAKAQGTTAKAQGLTGNDVGLVGYFEACFV